MNPRIGYDPARIRRLTRSTLESIDALAAIRSDDPAADDAVLVARNARRNLEDTWMPLLREIESSAAMTGWQAAALAGVRAEWASTSAWLSHLPHRDLDDAALLAEIARLDERVPLVHDEATRAELDRWLDGQRGLAAELARRVRADPAFAAELTATAYGSPLVGMLVGRSGFPADFRADLLSATLADPWWEMGWERDKHAAAANTLLRSLLADPRRCLDVLGRAGAAPTLGGWPPLDQDLVADFVVTALLVAPGQAPELLPAGYRSLRRFVRLANEQAFDGVGFEPGAATGLARAIAGYVPTLIPGLENEHAPVVVKSRGTWSEFDLELGSREELVDFFGAIVRTPAAQVEIGDVLDAAVRDALGDDPQVTIGDVAEFAELLMLAASNEDEELAMAAAARQSSLLRVGGLIGLAIVTGAAKVGVTSTKRALIGYTTRNINDAVVDTVKADSAGGDRLRSVAYQSIQIEACRRFATDPELRRAHGASGAGGAGGGRLRSIGRRLATAQAVMADPGADPGDRQRAVLNLVESVRDAGGGPYLDAILEENSVDDLNEAGHSADL